MNVDIDISNIVLYTERLKLRPWELKDIDDFFEYASVDGVGQMAGWQHHKDKNRTKEILDNFILEKKTFALEYKGKVIGSLGIEKYKPELFPIFENLKCREIGCVLSKDYWGMGLMPEAIDRVVEFLFANLKLDAISYVFFITNTQSKRVSEKCGFKHYAFGSELSQDGNAVEFEMRILSKNDWMKRD